MKYLPEFPNLQYLLREAKAIRSDHRRGDASVCSKIGHFDTSLHGLSEEQILDTRFSILDAQRVVARQYGFSSWARLKRFARRAEAGRSPSDVGLRDAVLARHTELRSLQQDVQRKQRDYKGKYRRYRELAQKSTSFLNSAYDRHGWPGPDVVGPDCVEALTLVSANALYDADFQLKTAHLMGRSLSEGGFSARTHAMPMDRYLVLSGRPTVYGCSFGSYLDEAGNVNLLCLDVVDPENVDRRRATVGFETMAAEQSRYAREVQEGDWTLSTREREMSELNRLSIEGGYRVTAA